MAQAIKVKTILNKSKGRDAWFLDDYTLNPYSGCSLNCQYCYTRGSKYGIHQELKVSYKENAPELLEQALRLRSKKNQFGYIVLSSATDPYVHFEEELQLTKNLLEIINYYSFPVHVITKSTLVLRDFALLKTISQRAIKPVELEHLPGTLLTFSFSTLDEVLAKRMEPGAPTPEERLLVIGLALRKGLYTGISLMPLLPYLSDTEDSLKLFYDTFAKLKVKYVLPAGLTLLGQGPSDSLTLVIKCIEKFYPELLPKYQHLYNMANSSAWYHYQSNLMIRINQWSNQYLLPTRIQ